MPCVRWPYNRSYPALNSGRPLHSKVVQEERLQKFIDDRCSGLIASTLLAFMFIAITIIALVCQYYYLKKKWRM